MTSEKFGLIKYKYSDILAFAILIINLLTLPKK